MSSKAVGQQQPGRRTPLSLTGGKNNYHQQQNQANSNKGNNNSNNNAAKNQESKDSTTNNKNNNQMAKNQQESRDLPSTQKDTKKTQQNGNKHVTADNGNKEIVFAEQNGTANGNSSNGVSNKSNGNTMKLSNQAGNKDNKEKEKEKDKEAESVKEKQEEKPKKGAAAKVNDKKQNDGNEKQAAPTTPSTNSNKSKDGNTTPTPSPAAEKKQIAQIATPPKSNTSSSALRKSNTPSKTEKTEKSAATSPTKSPLATATKTAATSKSPKAASSASSPATEISPEVIEIDENNIEPLIIESSPAKKSVAKNAIAPAATSTPGKAIGSKRGNNDKSEIQLTMETHSGSDDRKSVPRSYSDISGRRSIRNSGDFTPSMYNSQFRESYRRINTELDVTGYTNTSMNVTVGSEIPNNSSFLSFSLFGRGRKRERTPPITGPGKSQSAVELTTETTPPKRARLDVSGIFSAMSSPLTMLRTRFSKTTLDTPNKDEQPTIDDDVQNVSGVSIEEVVSSAEVTATEDITVGKEVVPEATPSKTTPVKEKETAETVELQNDDANASTMDIDGDIKITETPIIPAVGEPKTKQKGCLIM